MMSEEPARERIAEERAAIERGGKKWAVGIGAVLVAIAIGVAAYNPHHTATPAERKADAQRACQEKFIPGRLKAPSTAKFSNVTVTTSLETYTVTGSVDAENSFGAAIRSTFTCVMHSSGDQWVLDNAAVN